MSTTRTTSTTSTTTTTLTTSTAAKTIATTTITPRRSSYISDGVVLAPVRSVKINKMLNDSKS